MTQGSDRRRSDVTLDAKIPAGPARGEVGHVHRRRKLVNPDNKRKFEIIVVGTGLAGARPPPRSPSSATR